MNETARAYLAQPAVERFETRLPTLLQGTAEKGWQRRLTCAMALGATAKPISAINGSDPTELGQARVNILGSSHQVNGHCATQSTQTKLTHRAGP